MRNNDDGRTGAFTSGLVSIWGRVDDGGVLYGLETRGGKPCPCVETTSGGIGASRSDVRRVVRNTPKLKGVEILLSFGLAHGRLQFLDFAANFPEECRYVLETWGKVITTTLRRKSGNCRRNIVYNFTRSTAVL